MEKIENITEEKVQEIMRRLTFFEAFSFSEIQAVTDFYTHFYVYRPGEHIILEGERNTAFYILLSGQVLVKKNTGTFPLAQLEPGDFFGEISFLTGAPRTTNVVAKDTVIVIRVNQDMMKDLSCSIREKIKDQILYKVMDRLARTNDVLISLAY